jgi:hypothetical protein
MPIRRIIEALDLDGSTSISPSEFEDAVALVQWASDSADDKLKAQLTFVFLLCLPLCRFLSPPLFFAAL